MNYFATLHLCLQHNNWLGAAVEESTVEFYVIHRYAYDQYSETETNLCTMLLFM